MQIKFDCRRKRKKSTPATRCRHDARTICTGFRSADLLRRECNVQPNRLSRGQEITSSKTSFTFPVTQDGVPEIPTPHLILCSRGHTLPRAKKHRSEIRGLRIRPDRLGDHLKPRDIAHRSLRTKQLR